MWPKRFEYFKWMLSFSLQGKGFLHKISAFILGVAMWHPFVSNSPIIHLYKKIFGTNLKVRHRFFNYNSVTFNLTNTFEMVIAKEFFRDNIYDLSAVKFIPSVIFDFGAHIGLFTLLARSRYPTPAIHSYEPIQQNYQKIELAAAENQLSNCFLYKEAIGITNGETVFFTNGVSSSVDNSTVESDTKISVRVKNIYDLPITQNKLLLKMDIEGAEVEIFPGIISKFPPTCAVFLETHDGWNSLQPIKEEFLKNGFSFNVTAEKGRYIDVFAQRIESSASVN